MNAVRIAVNDRTKRLSLSETLTTGSTYAVSVDGGAATCGAAAVMTVASPDGTELASSTLANGAGTLSLDSQAVADRISGVPFGATLQWHVLLRSLDEGEEQNVAVGHVAVVAAKYPTVNPDAGQIAFVGPKGDAGAAGKDAYDIAVDKGFEGSRTAWLASLKGETGPAGTIGYVKDKDVDKWYALYVTTNSRGEKVLALAQTESESIPSAGEFTGRAELAATEASEAQVAAEAAQAAAEDAAEQAAIDAAAAAAESAATAAAAAIAQPVADAAASAENAEAWANGTRDDEPVDDEDPAHQNNAKYWKGVAANQATAASASAVAAAGSAEDSEAWAKGTRGGTAVGSTDPAYQNSSEYWAGQAADSATAASGSATAASGSADAAAAAVTAFTTGSVTITGTKTFTGTVDMTGAVDSETGESLVTVPTIIESGTEDTIDTSISDDTAASTKFVHAACAEAIEEASQITSSFQIVETEATLGQINKSTTISGTIDLSAQSPGEGFVPVALAGFYANHGDINIIKIQVDQINNNVSWALRNVGSSGITSGRFLRVWVLYVNVGTEAET